MKKFLALTIVAGSALGIAATTTACNNDPIKAQVELGIRASLGLERAAVCNDTFANIDNDGTQTTEVEDCIVANGLFSAKDALISKVNFSDFKITKTKETDKIHEFAVNFKATMKKDAKEVLKEIVGGEVRNIDGKWYITDLVQITPTV